MPRAVLRYGAGRMRGATPKGTSTGWVVVALCAALLGCASEHERGCPDLEAVLAFQAAENRLTCARAARCWGDGTEPYGVDSYDGYYCAWPPADPDGMCERLRSGVLRFHPEHVEACVAAMEARATSVPCRSVAAPGRRPSWEVVWEACRGVIESRPAPVDPEADCTSLGECPDGYECIAREGCGGRCVPGRALGEPCGATAGCGPGLYCDWDGTRLCETGCWSAYDCPGEVECVWHVCGGTPPGEGEECDRIQAPCRGDDLFCDAGTGRCARKALPGEACTPGSCVLGVCGETSGVCESGSTCAPGFEDGELACFGAQPYCSSTRSCTSDGSQAVCTFFAGGSEIESCGPGFGCEASASLPLTPYYERCVPLLPEGAPCGRDGVCDYGTTCTGGVCVHVVTLDERCGVDGACLPQFTCVDGACRDVHTQWLGEPCGPLRECIEGYCADGVCAWRAPGEACGGASECPGGGPCDGHCAATPIVGEGASCDDGTTVCAPGMNCLPTSVGGPRICHARCVGR